jgi:hypothetical protein
MKKLWVTVILAGAMILPRTGMAKLQNEDPVERAVKTYFATSFERLKEVADKKPTVDTLRADMAPLVKQTDGFFGGTLIDTNFVIRQVYNPRDFLARGFDLKKVRQLDDFWAMMQRAPTPQLSEPAHGNIMQPRLIAMRYPIITDGKLTAIVSMMVRTGAFLKATGLDQCKGYRITCRGTLAEEYGKLTGDTRRVTLALPATEWVIEYTP